MKELTKRELQVLKILWELKNAFVNEVIDRFPEPKPPYTTVSSIIRILETKGYVDHHAFGKTHQYFPVISRLSYKKETLRNLITDFFDGSLEKVVSLMVEEKELTDEEADEIAALIETYKNREDNATN